MARPDALPPCWVVRRFDEQRRDQARPDQHDAHDRRGGRQECSRVGDAPRRRAASWVVPRVPLAAVDERHHGDTRLEAAQTERKLRKDQDGARINRDGSPFAVSAERQCATSAGCVMISKAPRPRTTRFNARYGSAAAVARPMASEKPRRNTTAKTTRMASVTRIWWSPSTCSRNGFSIACLAGVGAGQRHRDDKVRGREAEQQQHERLALPAREKILEQRDRTLTGIAAPGHLRIDRQRAQQRHQHENDGRNRRHGARRQQRDARLVAERGKVVDPGQPDDFPPRMGRGTGAGVIVEQFAARQPASDP